MDIVNTILQEQNDVLNKSINVEKPIELEIDEGALVAFDPNTCDTKSLRSNTEEYLQSLARDNTQLLINKIWDLPTERVDEVVVAKLPKPTYTLPRSLPVPKAPILTKWQQFAKEKGISKKKKQKTKKQWDEELNKWIPNFGYQKNKAQQQKEWVVEVGPDNTPKANPREMTSKAKQERIAKNELQRLRNIAKSRKIKVPKAGVPAADKFSSSKQLAMATAVARVSTASAGKFQRRLPKEKTNM